MSNNHQVKVAVIGGGNMGRHHCRVFSELPQAELVVVCDAKQEVAQALAAKFNCQFQNDYQIVLRDKSIEAVSIAVPTALHHQVALAAIEAGKHLLIEKPIASTLEQGQEIIDKAKEKGVVLTIGHIERFNPAIRELKKLLGEGEIGEVVSLLAKRVGPTAPQIKDVSVLIDLAVHDIDVFNYLLERSPEEVYARGGKIMQSDRENYAHLALKYGEALGYVQVNWITPVKIRTLCLTGTKAYAEVDYVTQKLDLYKAEYKREQDEFGNPLFKFEAAKKISIDVPFAEPLKLELASFLASIADGAPVVVSGQDGLSALSIVLQSLNSINN